MSGSRACIEFSLALPGSYRGIVEVREKSTSTFRRLGQELQLISLGDAEWAEVERAEKLSGSPSFEALLLSEGPFRGKTVYIYVTPRRLIVKYFYLGIIPSRIAAVRVAPIAELKLLDGYEGDKARPVMALCERGDAQVILACQRRNVVCTLFSRFLSSRSVYLSLSIFGSSYRRVQCRCAGDLCPEARAV
jgi:hypothetical protein